MRIWFAVSGHGFGHLVQTAPILNALRTRHPALVLHIAGNVPEELARRWLEVPFTLGRPHGDALLVQEGPLSVDLEATRSLLRELHDHWEVHLPACREEMERWQPDLVISNVPYLPVAAAAALGIPSAVISSISWDRVLAECFSLDDPEVRRWWLKARESYRCAGLAIGLTPWALDAEFCPRVVRVDPPFEPFQPAKGNLRKSLGLSDDRPLVLLTMGGMPAGAIPETALQAESRVIWLVPGSGHLAPNVYGIERLPDWQFPEIAGSVDAIVGKLGYNTVVQAAASGVPFLYVRRPPFPDEDALAVWSREYHRVREMNPEDFHTGRGWYEHLRALWSMPAPAVLPPSGLDDALGALTGWIRKFV